MTYAAGAGLAPYYSEGGITIYCGDCREILSRFDAVSFDAVITDPPYQTLDVQVSNGTTTRLVSRDAFGGKPLAASDGVEWFSTLDNDALCGVLETCRGLLKPDGAMYVYADVKSGLPLFSRLGARNVIVWDKQKLGMGYAWRRMHEWIGYFPQPDHALRDLSAGDIIRCNGVADKCHPTEKPSYVSERLIVNSTDSGEIVLDPFAGSGSTLIAAKMAGRRAVGIEREARYCEIAANRLRQGCLFGVPA